MSDGTWRHDGNRFGGPQKRHTARGSTSRTKAMKALGSVVYAARLADGTIKFGWTEHFDLRLHWLKHYTQQDIELLAFRIGGEADEQAIHAELESHRHHAREYYNPTPDVMAVVNKMRSDLGLPLLAA